MVAVVREVGSSAFGSRVVSSWGHFVGSVGQGGPALPEDGGLKMPYARFILCSLEPSLAMCPGVEPPYPAAMGAGRGHHRGLEQQECAGREQGDQDPGDLGAAPFGHRENLAEPRALRQAGWGRDKGISLG